MQMQRRRLQTLQARGFELASAIFIEDASHLMFSLNRLSVVGIGKLGACLAATLAL